MACPLHVKEKELEKVASTDHLSSFFAASLSRELHISLANLKIALESRRSLARQHESGPATHPQILLRLLGDPLA